MTLTEIAEEYYLSRDHLKDVRKALEAVREMNGTEVPDSPAYEVVWHMNRVVKEAEERWEAAIEALATTQRGPQQ